MELISRHRRVLSQQEFRRPWREMLVVTGDPNMLDVLRQMLDVTRLIPSNAVHMLSGTLTSSCPRVASADGIIPSYLRTD